jgi:hypothetical protein
MWTDTVGTLLSYGASFVLLVPLVKCAMIALCWADSGLPSGLASQASGSAVVGTERSASGLGCETRLWAPNQLGLLLLSE